MGSRNIEYAYFCERHRQYINDEDGVVVNSFQFHSSCFEDGVVIQFLKNVVE
jgi:hypothetical protein